MRSRLLSIVTLCLATSAIAACGGSQSPQTTDRTECPDVKAEGMTATEWNSWAECVNRRGALVEQTTCGRTLQWSSSATPAALHAATACVLDAENRTDVTYIGDALHGIAFEDDKIVAIAEALPGHFEQDRHGNILAGSITENGQMAIGRVLGQLEGPTVELLFNLALRHNLRLLAAEFDDFPGADALRSSADEELIDQFAQQISHENPYSETERWALARSGTWSADDIIRCHTQNLRGCGEWEGERPISLLDEAVDRGQDARTPGMIVTAATQEGGSREDAAVAVRWISQTPGGGGQTHLRSMINGMTTPSFRENYRYGVAEAATEELCAVPLVSQAARRASSDDDDSRTSVWNTFLTRCNDAHWTWRDRLAVISLGSDLNAHPRVMETIADGAVTTSEQVSCDTLLVELNDIEEAQRAYDRPMIGLVYGVAADMRSDCFETLHPALRRIAGAEQEHPEGRLKAIEMLAEHGDTEFCASLPSIRQWSPGEDQPGFTPLAEELKSKAEDACE